MTLPANLDQLSADELRELVRQQSEVITHKDRELNWRKVKIEHVIEAAEGTLFGRIMQAMRVVTDPILPAEVGLIKAAVLIGCALSGKRDKPPFKKKHRKSQ